MQLHTAQMSAHWQLPTADGGNSPRQFLLYSLSKGPQRAALLSAPACCCVVAGLVRHTSRSAANISSPSPHHPRHPLFTLSFLFSLGSSSGVGFLFCEGIFLPHPGRLIRSFASRHPASVGRSSFPSFERGVACVGKTTAFRPVSALLVYPSTSLQDHPRRFANHKNKGRFASFRLTTLTLFEQHSRRNSFCLSQHFDHLLPIRQYKRQRSLHQTSTFSVGHPSPLPRFIRYLSICSLSLSAYSTTL